MKETSNHEELEVAYQYVYNLEDIPGRFPNKLHFENKRAGIFVKLAQEVSNVACISVRTTLTHNAAHAT
jgi:hypothetical protein